MAKTERPRRSRWWLLLRLPLGLVAFVAALVVTLLLTISLLLRTESFNDWLLAKVLPPVCAKINARIEVGSLYVSLLPTRLILHDAVFTASDDTNARPFASAELIDAQLDLLYLMLGQIHLTEVRVRGADNYLLFGPDGLVNLPKFPKSDKPPSTEPPHIDFPLTVERLLIEDMSFGLEIPASRLKLEAPAINGRASCDLRGSAFVDLTLEQVSFDLGDRVHERVDRLALSKTEFRFNDWTALIRGLQIELPYGRLAAAGRLDDVVGRKALDLQLNGELDLAHANPDYLTEPRLSGTAQVDLRVTGELPEFIINGSLKVPRGAVNDLALSDLEIGLELDRQGVAAKSLELRTAGGRISGAADLRFGQGTPLNAMLNLYGVDLQRTLSGYDIEVPAGGTASGFVRVDGPLSPLDLDMDTTLALIKPRYGPAADPLIAPPAASVTAGVRLTTDVLTIKHARLAVEHNQVTARGSLGLKSKRIELTAELDMPDLSALGPLAGNAPAGALTGQARISGPLSRLRIAADVDGRDLVYGPYSGGDLTCAAVLDGKRLEISELIMTTDRGRLELSGNLTLAKPYPLELQAKIDQAPLDDLLSAAGLQLDLHGLLQGSVALTGDLERPTGVIELSVADGAAYGEHFENLALAGRLDQGLLELQQLEVRKAEGRTLNVSGRVNLPERSLDLTLAGHNLRLEDLDNLRERGIALAGDLGLQAAASGPFSALELTAQLELSDTLYGERPLGESRIEAALSGGRFEAHGSLVNERISLSAAGELSGDDPRIDATLRIDGFELTPYLNFDTAVPMQGSLGGEVVLVLPLKRMNDLEVRAVISELTLNAGDFSLANSTPIELIYADGRLDARDFALGGKGGVHTLTLTRSEVRPGLAGFYLEGSIDLQILHAFVPAVADARGDLVIDLWLTNDFSEFRPEGTIRLVDGRLDIKNFPQPVQDLQAIINFDRDRINLELLSARVGATGNDPNLKGSGQVLLDGFSPKQMRFMLSVDRMTTGYAPDLDVVLESMDLLLAGNNGRYDISGEVNVERAVYTKDIDLVSILQSFRSKPPVGVAIYEEQEPFVFFNVAVHAQDKLIFSNNFAKVELGGDLIVTGNDVDMGLLGHLFLIEGTAEVLNNTYDISSVSIQFYDQTRIWPNFEVNAETTVDEINILVNVHGDPDNVEITFNSDPPHSDQDIISLLTLGMSYEEFQSSGQVSAQQALGWTANKIIGDRLNKIAGRYTGINVSIDTSGGSTRIVISKELGKDLVAAVYRDVVYPEMGAELEYGFIRYLKLKGMWSSRTNPIDPQSFGSLGAGLVLTIEFQ